MKLPPAMCFPYNAPAMRRVVLFAALVILTIYAGWWTRGVVSHYRHRPEPPPDLTAPVAEREDRHAELMAMPVPPAPDAVILGDSIAERWPADLLPFGPAVVNLGVAWDRVENVLWRVRAGELDRFRARRLILLVGSNNLSRGDPPEAVARGVAALVAEVRARQPGAALLLVAVLPREPDFNDPCRRRIRDCNELLAAWARAEGIDFRNPGPMLLLPDGTLDPSLVPDGTHPSPAGYAALAAALR
jgi:lysophospholipase L1-like esterase